MSNIVLVILGTVLAIIGIFNYFGHIETIHWYNRTKITEETRKPYGRAVGIGTVIIGDSIVITSVLDMIFHNELVYFVLVAGVVIGLVFILYGQIKYNKGLF